MEVTDQDIVTKLKNAMRDAREQEDINAEQCQDVNAFLHALGEGLFEFEIECWHGADDEFPGEMLLRVYKDESRAERFANGEPLKALYNNGLGPFIDFFLTKHAFAQAVSETVSPVSINISPQSIVSQRFWDVLLPALGEHDPHMLIFEILEPDVPEEGDLDVIDRMRAQGYRFALDDTHHGHYESRLEYFKRHVDYVKIDGRAIRAEFDQEDSSLSELIEKIRSQSPGARLVAEWVRSADEQEHLNGLGIEHSQGRELPSKQSVSDKAPQPGDGLKPPR